MRMFSQRILILVSRCYIIPNSKSFSKDSLEVFETFLTAITSKVITMFHLAEICYAFFT